MKKMFSLMLAISLLVSLCGCVSDTDVRGDITNTVPKETENSFVLGKTENNCYQNDYLGITCTLPSEWEFYTDEQILQINNFAVDFFDEDFAEVLKNATIIYDMYAMNTNDSGNVNVNLEKFSVWQIATLDLKTSIEKQLPSLETSFSNLGYTNIQTSYQKVTVDGKEYDAAKVTAEINGIKYYGVTFCFKKGIYVANISVSSMYTDKIDTLLSCFTIS